MLFRRQVARLRRFYYLKSRQVIESRLNRAILRKSLDTRSPTAFASALPAIAARAVIALSLIACWTFSAAGQSTPVASPVVNAVVRPMVLTQTRYEIQAGQSIPIAAPQETLDFLAHSAKRQVAIVTNDTGDPTLAS